MNSRNKFGCILLCICFPLAARDRSNNSAQNAPGAAEFRKGTGDRLDAGRFAPVHMPAKFYDIVDQRSGIKVHVRLDSFLMSPTEVTEQEFESVMGFNPSQYRGTDLPVENVSWWDAIRYCNRRSAREHLQPAYDLSTGRCDRSQNGYRLPTEAEWEEAADEATKVDLKKIATLGSSDTKDIPALMQLVTRGPSAVAAHQPNRWGLYDMLGNVWEWCQDFFGPVISFPDANNPHGPELGIARVIRGGSFASSTSSWSKGYRSSLAPETRSRFTGFRVCRTVTPVCTSGCEPKQPNWGSVYQQAPAGLATSIGNLKPLINASTSREQWKDHAAQLKQKWDDLLGTCPAAIASPAVKAMRTIHDASYTGTLAALEVEPHVWEDIFVMRPNGPVEHPRPAVIVPFYDVDPSAGVDLGGRRFSPPSVRSFALLAVQRGYVAVAVRWFGEGEGESYPEAVANLALRDPGCTGLGKWVSDAHTLVNYVAALPDVDPHRIAIIGHSLGGKMALYAAAFDPRIAVTVSSEPGIGFSHSNYDDYWYFGKRLASAPAGTDQHELLGLIAPRPFLLIGGDKFDGADSWHYINAARRVYSLYGEPNAIGFLDHHQGHSPTPEAAFQAMEWLRHYLE